MNSETLKQMISKNVSDITDIAVDLNKRRKRAEKQLRIMKYRLLVMERALEIASEQLSSTYIKTACRDNSKSFSEEICRQNACPYLRRLSANEWEKELLKKAEKEINDKYSKRKTDGKE